MTAKSQLIKIIILLYIFFFANFIPNSVWASPQDSQNCIKKGKSSLINDY